MIPVVLAPCLLVQALSATPSYPAWPQLAQTVLLLKSAEGAAKVFQDNPRLAATYAEEANFVGLVQPWRERLNPLPPRAADLNPQVATVQFYPANETAMVAYLTFRNETPQGSLTYLKLTWEPDSLAKVEFFRGFLRTLPTVPAFAPHWRPSPGYDPSE